VKHLIQKYLFTESLEEDDISLSRSHWLIRLRWIAIIFQCIFIFAGISLSLINIYAFSFSLFVIIILSMVNSYFSIKIYEEPEYVASKNLLQICIDIIEVILLLFVSGGLKNPFSMILIIHIYVSGLIVSRKENRIVFLWLVLGLIALALSPYKFSTEALAFSAEYLNISSIAFCIFITWQLSSWLNEKEKKLRSRLEQLKSKSIRQDRLKALGALTAGLCHELNTPLNTIRFKVDRLKRKKLCLDEVSVIENALKQCEESLMKIEGKKSDVEAGTMQELVVTDLVSELVDNWKSGKGQISVALPTSKRETKVLLPKLSFTRSFLDILDNCQQAQASIITLEIEELHGRVLIHISDNGIGLPDIVLSKLGEPFITTKERGNGLGLYNALALCEFLDGNFFAKNNKDGGALITMSLPIYEEEK